MPAKIMMEPRVVEQNDEQNEICGEVRIQDVQHWVSSCGGPSEACLRSSKARAIPNPVSRPIKGRSSGSSSTSAAETRTKTSTGRPQNCVTRTKPVSNDRCLELSGSDEPGKLLDLLNWRMSLSANRCSPRIKSGAGFSPGHALSSLEFPDVDVTARCSGIGYPLQRNSTSPARLSISVRSRSRAFNKKKGFADNNLRPPGPDYGSIRCSSLYSSSDHRLCAAGDGMDIPVRSAAVVCCGLRHHHRTGNGQRDRLRHDYLRPALPCDDGVPAGSAEPTTRVNGRSYPLFLVFLILTVTIAVIGAIAYRAQSSALKQTELDRLQAIAELKVDDINRWMSERRAKAASFSRNPVVVDMLRHYLAGDEQEASACSPARRNARQLRFLECGAAGRPRAGCWSPTVNTYPRRRLRSATVEAVTSGKVMFVDLHRDAPGAPAYMAFVAPVFDRVGDGKRRAGGHSFGDPGRPLSVSHVQNWPLPTATGETILVRREGENVLYLNDLRHRADLALSLRLPVTARSFRQFRPHSITSNSLKDRLPRRQSPGRRAAGARHALDPDREGRRG